MLRQSTHFASVRKLTGFSLAVALYAYSGSTIAVTEVETLPVSADAQACIADGINCNKPMRDQEQMKLCQEDPSAEGCMRPLPPPPCNPDEADCELPPEVAERIALCQENPDAEDCMRPLPPPPCNPDEADCELPPEIAEKMALCQENPDAEDCKPHALIACNPDEADCELPPEIAERMALCQENPDAEGCGRPEHAGQGSPEFKMHHSNRCRVNPDFCNNPGPSTLNLEEGVLELPVVRLPRPDGTGDHYGARLRMSEDGMSFTLEEVTYLEDESNETQE